ncbi:GNAT family N-acetyltransferase [Candidatus Pacearchaeota archaeon]|nr:GNAT family N-acetyltransferase [Candidatus Pacearchaeota archaeon]
MKIRKATKKDVKEVVGLFRKEYAKPPYNEKWPKKAAQKYVGGKSEYFFVAVENNEIVGFIQGNIYSWYDGLRGHINEIVVDSKYQGKGIGKGLLNFIIKEFKKRKVKTLALSAKKKAKALDIYKKLKFKDEGYISLKKRLR